MLITCGCKCTKSLACHIYNFFFFLFFWHKMYYSTYILLKGVDGISLQDFLQKIFLELSVVYYSFFTFYVHAQCKTFNN
jgi:hypothetical protein